VQEQAAARALLLSEPPVAAARPRALQATAAAQRAAGRPGLGCPLLQAWLGQAFHIFWTGLQPKPPPQPPRSASNEEDEVNYEFAISSLNHCCLLVLTLI